MTGDDDYRRFAEETVIGEMHGLEIALTTGAFRPPPWCTSYYGHHITFTPAWSLATLLGPSTARDVVAQVFVDEFQGKLIGDHDNAKFGLLYGSFGDAVPDAAGAQADAVAQLERLGGNGGVLDDPRRTYGLTYDAVVSALPDGITTRCPTEEERSQCEDGVTVFGINVPGEPITEACTGAASDCLMADGTCATALASSGLPADLRVYQDFLWQRSPFELGQLFGEDGRRQSPGLDLTESYWIARHTGAITEGQTIVLAWRPEPGTCP